jgi:hypothetical protein
MSVPSQSTITSIATQAAKVEGGTFTDADYDWYQHRATAVSLQPREMADIYPPEMGAEPVPSGAYKGAVMAEGGIEMIPRLKETLGYYLYGALGACDSQVDATWDTAANDFTSGVSTGVNAHHFTFASKAYTLPWMAFRKHIPGLGATDDSGEVMYDARVGSLTINVAPGSPLGLSVAARGSRVKYRNNAEVSAWTYQNTIEDATTAPHAGKGSVLIGGDSTIKVTSAQITFANQFEDVQGSLVAGSFFPDDIAVLQRVFNVRIVTKWKDAQLWRKLMTGTTTGTDWSSLPFIEATAGATKAFEATFESPGDITGASPATPYKLRIIANNMFWRPDQAGIALEAGNVIRVPLIGTAIVSTDNYVDIVLENDATYAFAT